MANYALLVFCLVRKNALATQMPITLLPCLVGGGDGDNGQSSEPLSSGEPGKYWLIMIYMIKHRMEHSPINWLPLVSLSLDFDRWYAYEIK